MATTPLRTPASRDTRNEAPSSARTPWSDESAAGGAAALRPMQSGAGRMHRSKFSLVGDEDAAENGETRTLGQTMPTSGTTPKARVGAYRLSPRSKRQLAAYVSTPSTQLLFKQTPVQLDDEKELASLRARIAAHGTPADLLATPSVARALPPHLTSSSKKKAATSAAVTPSSVFGGDAVEESNVPHQWRRHQAELLSMDESRGKASLEMLDAEKQEALLVADLLVVFLGLDGTYLAISHLVRPPVLYVAPGIVPELGDLCARLLPLSANVQIVRREAERLLELQRGLVAHALGACVLQLVDEYMESVVRLDEEGVRTVERLWYRVQPAMRNFELLADLVGEASLARGGHLINVVHARRQRLVGDAEATQLYDHLLHAMMTPYLAMLESWIFHGHVDDRYSEFMVRRGSSTLPAAKTLNLDSKNVSRLFDDAEDGHADEDSDDDAGEDGSGDASHARGAKRLDAENWSHFYVLVDRRSVPLCLRTCERQVLQAGKYLNAVRQCDAHRVVSAPFAAPIAFRREGSDEENAYGDVVERAHSYASELLLRLLREEHRLDVQFGVLKHCFLLDRGDLLAHFMELAGAELNKPIADVSTSKLNALLGVALRLSSVDDIEEAWADALSCKLLPFNLCNQLLRIIETRADGSVDVHAETLAAQRRAAAALTSATKRHERVTMAARRSALPAPHNVLGIEALAFDYAVAWPNAIVLNSKALAKYQLLLRQLMLCKHVEGRVSHSVRATLKGGVRRGSKLHWLFFRASLTRQKCVHLLQNLLYYMSYEVLDAQWQRFEQRRAAVRTIDELIRQHTKMLDACLRGCLLTDAALVRLTAKLLSICDLFATFYAKAYEAAATAAREEEQYDDGVDAAAVVLTELEFNLQIQKLDGQFNALMTLFLTALQRFAVQEERVSHLLVRLDFADFYTLKSIAATVDVFDADALAESPGF